MFAADAVRCMRLSSGSSGGGGGDSYKYWRLTVGATNSAQLLLLVSYHLLDSNNEILRDQAIVTASYVDLSYPPNNALDDNTNSYWFTSTLPQWIQYAFPEPVSPESLLLRGYASTPSRSPRDFVLQASNNGTEWSNIIIVTGLTEADWGSIQLSWPIIY